MTFWDYERVTMQVVTVVILYRGSRFLGRILASVTQLLLQGELDRKAREEEVRTLREKAEEVARVAETFKKDGVA